MEAEDIEKIVDEKLSGLSVLSKKQHDIDHDWIRSKIKSEENRAFFYKKAAEVMVQWSVVGVLGYLGIKFGFQVKT